MTLSDRERQVLELAADHSTRAIAEHLGLSEDTVYTHVQNAMRKLGVHTRADAVRMLREGSEPARPSGG